MVKTILITGHTGFLGSVIYQELVKSFNVVTLGRSSSNNYVVDLEKWNGLIELTIRVDAIVHVAGLAHNKSTSAQQMWEVNANAVKKLLSFATDHNIENFIFMSSVAVYGKSIGLQIDETLVPEPSTVFAKSKLHAERLITNWSKHHQKRSHLNLRLPLIIGPNLQGNLKKLQRNIASGSHLFLFGNNARKSVVFASDISFFICNWLLTTKKESGTINLCNATAPSFNWIEEAMAVKEDKKFRYRIPFRSAWKLISVLKTKLDISLPLIGKMFYSLTYSDKLARDKFNYTSQPLNQTTFSDALDTTH